MRHFRDIAELEMWMVEQYLAQGIPVVRIDESWIVPFPIDDGRAELVRGEINITRLAQALWEKLDDRHHA